jgi:hypothetical protein
VVQGVGPEFKSHIAKKKIPQLPQLGGSGVLVHAFLWSPCVFDPGKGPLVAWRTFGKT